ncbi:MAG: glycoside hydrolase family 9 protein [Bacteroidota bacterium]
MKSILSFLFTVLFFSVIAQSTDSIRINQLGYYPKAQKIAILTGVPAETDFYIVGDEKNDTVWSAKSGPLVQSKNSSIKASEVYFTALEKEGNYKIIVPLLGASYPFTIKTNVIAPAAVAALKGFYFIRSNTPLTAKFAGKWARPAGHADTEVLVHPSAATDKRPAGTIISTPGGWYDAGDYNKYIVNSGISMGTLLSAYEEFPSYFKLLKTNIPETGNGVPDILNEALYNLRWMFTMQDPDDGGVYNKCTNAAFDGMVMPGVTRLPRYVVQKGTTATLDFVAVMAQASRIFAAYKKQLPGLSDSCLKAALYAWDWAGKNPAMEYNQNSMNRMMHKPAISTGGYGDKNFGDEWLWASAEMYVTTKDEAYYKLIARNINNPLTLPTWNNVFALAFYTLSRNENTVSPIHAGDIKTIKTAIINMADSYKDHYKENAFRTVMGLTPKDFNWGSSSNAANQGILLINAYKLSGKLTYLDAALTNVDYLLGRNATAYSFLTGVGSKTPMHPHHRPSVADGIEEPVPGLLSGGPNPAKQDSCNYLFSEPETAFSDTDCSYASNEIAINWNAPAVYLFNALEALQFEAGYAEKKTVAPKKK